jgi:predicted neutral ceramidase superfamily lipid hydrolase
MREVALIAALAMIGLFTFLTLSVAVRDGVDILTVISVIVLAMFGFGIVGALRNPPDR